MRISTDALAVLSRCSISGRGVVLPEQLDRKLYIRVNEVLTALGGRWDRRAKAHVFEADPAGRLDDAIVSGEVDHPADFGFFPTPAGLAARLVAEARIGRGDRVLEPSAGHGALLRAASGMGAELVAVELMAANAQLLRGLGLATVHEGDFLSMVTSDLGGPFDRVVMNAPFSRKQDITHTQHALGMLRPGGRLASIMGAGVAFRADQVTTDFRALVARSEGTIEALPDDSFKASGTGVLTVLVVMERS